MSTPLGKLVQPLVEWLHQWHLWGPTQRGVQGPSLWLSLPVVFGSALDTLSSSWRPHCRAGTPIRRVGSGLAWLYSLQFIEEDLTQGVLSATWLNNWCVWQKNLLPKFGKTAMKKSNKFFHTVNVINNALSSDSDLRLRQWPRFTPLLSQSWTNNLYLPALMIRLELTHLVCILLIFIKPMLHNMSRDLYNGLLLNKQGTSSTYKWYPQGITDKLLWSA